MALSGRINGSVTYNSNIFSFYATWSAAQSISGNYSDVTVTTYWQTSNIYWGFDTVGSRSASITVNGETKSISKRFDTTNGSGSSWNVSNPYPIQTVTQRVYHNSDGTKSITISVRANGHAADWGPSSSISNSADCTASGTITLDTIPRAASITAAPNFNDEANPTITYSNPAGDSVSSLQACISLTGAADDVTYRDISKTGTSYTFNLTEAERNVLRKATTGGNSRTVRFFVRTIIGGVTYHSQLEKTFSIINYTPTFSESNISYYDNNTSITNVTGNSDMIVQNKSSLVVKYTAATPKKSASISTYYFKLNGVTKTSTSAGGTVSFGAINSDSNLTLTAWCVDSRGNSSGEKTKTITCYEYHQPSFTSFDAYRANSDGSSNVNGTYLKNVYSTNYSSVGGKNTISVSFTYTTGSTSKTSTSALFNLGESSKTYNVYATITDSFGGKNTSSTVTVFGATRIFNVSKDGTNFAIGKMATDGVAELFDCRWPIRSDEPEQTMQNLSYRGQNLISSTANDTVANWNNQGNLATSFYTQNDLINGQPSQYGFLLNFSSGIGGREMHNLWFQQPNGDVSHRGGNGEGLGGWRKFLDSSNYTNWVSTKPVTLYSSSSGTIGTITLSESAANFTYLEIFYADNNSREPNSVKLYSPNGKYVSLSCIEPSTSGDSPRVYIRTSGWTISGTSMTVGRSDLSGANRGVYAQLYPHANGTNIDAKVEAQNYIKIFRILGYK